MRQLIALATAFLTVGCTGVQAMPNRPASATMTFSDQTVHLDGVRDIRFGAKRSDLSHRVNKQTAGCNVQVIGLPEGSLVFAGDDRLVLIWFDSPLRTPEGVGTGATVNAVRKAYPQARELTAPPKTYRFDAIRVADGDRGYLFLHDGKTVQKAIAGHSDYLDRLFNSGFGVC